MSGCSAVDNKPPDISTPFIIVESKKQQVVSSLKLRKKININQKKQIKRFMQDIK